MLLIILGAGASYDSLDFKLFPSHESHARRPPLAAHLFDARFEKSFAMFPQMGPVINAIQRSPLTLEETLDQLVDDAAGYPTRLEHLAAVRFYLRDVLVKCSVGWTTGRRRANNFVDLFDAVDRWRHENRERVAIVTFNYDSLVEQALNSNFGIDFQSLDDFIGLSPNYQLFKLHGSVDWMHPVHLADNPDPTVAQIIGRAGNGLEVGEEFLFRPSLGQVDQSSRGDVYPALAIPLKRQKNFECPSSHLDELRRRLPEVDRVLVIGWRGVEGHFLKMLHVGLRDARIERCLIAAGRDGGSSETEANLTAAGDSLRDIRVLDGGFGDLIRDDAIRYVLN